MLNHKDHFHGSDLEKIEQIYGIKKEEIVSFSANVNPLGLSTQLKESLSEKLDVITTYPDREYTRLRKAIGVYADTEYDKIIVGNGSTELISLFITEKHPRKALIIGPTYSEYEREISLGGGTSLYFPLEEENDFTLKLDDLADHLNESIDLLVICNPNNPTSSAIKRTDIRKILDLCKQYDIFVMIDETYVEFAPQYDAIASIPLTGYYDNLIILRGISKFFAAPGLRLGYAVTGNAELIRILNAKKDPWSINSIADVAGQLMFADTAYQQTTRALINSERTKVCEGLRQIPGLKVYTASANFVLVRIIKEDRDADLLFDAAIRQKMMVRNCSTFPFLDNKYFRICFMNPEDNDRLLKCIKETLA